MINHRPISRYVRNCLFTGTFIFFPSVLIADNPEAFSALWMTAEAGGSIFNYLHARTVEPMSGVDQSDYYINTNIQNAVVLGVGFGYQDASWGIYDVLPSNRMGFYYNYYMPVTVSGEIEKWQTTVAYDYTMNVQSSAAWISDQLDLLRWFPFVVFVEGGVGVAWNTASSYEETPDEGNPSQDQRAQSAAFSNNLNTDFAWRLGAGVNYILDAVGQQVTLTLLYRYVNLGTVRTGSSQNYSSMSQGLDFELRSNEVLGTLTYYFR